MISTEEMYETIHSSENEALEFFNQYTAGSNELSGKLAIVRFSAAFAYKIITKQHIKPNGAAPIDATVRYFSIRKAWAYTVSVGIQIVTHCDGTVCLIILFGQWAIIIGPHLSA